MEIKDIPDLNIFMMCEELNEDALSDLNENFHIRNIRRDELDIWKSFPFDNEEEALEYYGFMTDFYNDTYGDNEDLFYQKCLFVCDSNDKPVATCFIWKAYNEFNTIQWFKTLKGYEGLGIGRALLSVVMKNLNKDDYPIYLHTQPASFRAIKLYSDFGFAILTDPSYGSRTNDYEECLPILEEFMKPDDYKRLNFKKAPDHFKRVVGSATTNQF